MRKIGEAATMWRFGSEIICFTVPLVSCDVVRLQWYLRLRPMGLLEFAEFAVIGCDERWQCP